MMTVMLRVDRLVVSRNASLMVNCVSRRSLMSVMLLLLLFWKGVMHIVIMRLGWLLMVLGHSLSESLVDSMLMVMNWLDITLVIVGMIKAAMSRVIR